MNLVSRIAGAARLLATGKLAQSTGFDGAQIQRRLMAWRAGSESINSLILQGGELQRGRARQLVRTNPYASNASSSFTAHAVGCGIKPSSLVEDGALKDQIQRLWLVWTDEADVDGLTASGYARPRLRGVCLGQPPRFQHVRRSERGPERSGRDACAASVRLSVVG